MNKTLIAALSSVLAAGCLQGIGERCQVNADCASNICSNSTHVCVTSGNNNDQSPIDAEVPEVQIEAAVPMEAAVPTDAPVDAL